MPKTMFITGATDGIGLEAAKNLLRQGHRVLISGRNPDKLENVAASLSSLGSVESYLGDLSDLRSVKTLIQAIMRRHEKLDVLINNAGVLKVDDGSTAHGIDVRFVVNTLAPYMLTKGLLSLLGNQGRVINVSSAAQASVDLNALKGNRQHLETMAVYSQSKLALIMWSRGMIASLGVQAPTIVSVNPGSLLGTKMVQEGFGIAGKDIQIGAEILVHAAISDEFSKASGQYFDNDSGQFKHPHADAMSTQKTAEMVEAIEEIIAGLGLT